MRHYALVLAGGFCGAVTRYLLAAPLLALAATLPGARASFPYDILLINLSGAFAIGALYGAFERGANISPDTRLLLGTGFLGAYTTFSSFMVGADTLLREGRTLAALAYLVGAMVAGVALAWAGDLTAGALVGAAVGKRVAPRGLTLSEELALDGGWEAYAHYFPVDFARQTHHTRGRMRLVEGAGAPADNEDEDVEESAS